jgi:ABC-type branched-subunit amino acid transport system ATPase component
MNVVGDAADDDGMAVVLIEDAAEKAVQFRAEVVVDEEGAAVFGGEDGVDEDFGEGLGHVFLV